MSRKRFSVQEVLAKLNDDDGNTIDYFLNDQQYNNWVCLIQCFLEDTPVWQTNQCNHNVI